jgi:hypothetical protein
MTQSASDVSIVIGRRGRRWEGNDKFLARHLQNDDADESASEVATTKYFMPSSRMTLGLAIMLHNEFPISPT